MRIEIVDINPSVAKKMMEKNTGNFRPVNQGRVEAYSNDQSHGRWQFDGSPIRFGIDGELLDGQHRLLAIIRSGVTIRTVVEYDVEADGKHIDEHGPRSAAHWLRHLKMPNSSLLAACSRLILCHENKRWDWNNISNTYVSRDEIVKFCQANGSRLQQAVRMAKRTLNIKLGIRQSNIGAVIYLGARDNAPDQSELAKWFMDSLITGVNLQKTDPVFQLRERALVAASSPVQRWNAEHERAILCYTWNKTVAGEPLKQLKIAATGPTKQRIPYVVNEALLD
jgi:hypothetical protein